MTAGPSTGEAEYYVDPLTGRTVWPEGTSGYRATTTTAFTLVSSYPSIDFGYDTVLVHAPDGIVTTSDESTTTTATAPIAEEATSTEATTRSAGKSATTATTGATPATTGTTTASTKPRHAPPAPARYETPNLTG